MQQDENTVVHSEVTPEEEKVQTPVEEIVVIDEEKEEAEGEVAQG